MYQCVTCLPYHTTSTVRILLGARRPKRNSLGRFLQVCFKAAKEKPSIVDPVARLVQTCDFCLTWEDLPKIMKPFGLSPRDVAKHLSF